ncbi:hypothetical protein JI752_007720 [Lysobacter sp. MMG2]|uniref:hypothetical protein n=1 Tax=Lysobacter sp. MMG2 TaxID=2801338 RepID=UPI001C233A10|nr:hypothetical protein [Lysobacter sp. MMG2]MBU8976031.1 hypothetical protein [Lysobacter sp. MMG2]
MNATYQSYRPINCEFHDLLEDLATARRLTRVAYLDDAGTMRRGDGVITDVYARQGEEFLSMDSGETIRLDRLVEVHGQTLASFGNADGCAL